MEANLNQLEYLKEWLQSCPEEWSVALPEEDLDEGQWELLAGNE